MLYSTYISNIKNLDFEKSQIINIARYIKPKDIKSDYRLSPSPELFKAFKGEDITFNDFEYYFKEEMTKYPMVNALRELYVRAKNEDVVIVCCEKDYTECHRRLIGEFLQSHGIKYKEIEGE